VNRPSRTHVLHCWLLSVCEERPGNEDQHEAVVSAAVECLLSCGTNGEKRGNPYSMVRGEILRPMEDAQERRQFPSVSPLIKNDSMGIEDDQIPS